MKHIFSRNNDELIKKVFLAQQDSPRRGDFVKLVQKDIKDIGVTYEEIMSENIRTSEESQEDKAYKLS